MLPRVQEGLEVGGPCCNHSGCLVPWRRLQAVAVLFPQGAGRGGWLEREVALQSSPGLLSAKLGMMGGKMNKTKFVAVIPDLGG